MFKIKVNENEKALLYKDEKFIELLNVGVHKMFHLWGNNKVEKVDINHNGIAGDKARKLYRLFPDAVKKYFTVVELADNERAFVHVNDALSDFLALGEIKLYWKELDVTVERVDIRADYRLTDEHRRYIDLFTGAVHGVSKHTIADHEIGYLYHDETLVETLSPGAHYIYNELNNTRVARVDTRIQELEVNAQELLTADKVTIRCNLTLHYRITDGITYLSGVDAPGEYLHKQLQFAARKHIGALEIDAVLSAQHTLSDEIRTEFAAACDGIGIEVIGVHIKDIILPGEMREIFNRVIEATKKAEANNIKRREETAATRSLLNTAKLMKDNPALARLKELEALEKITQTVGTLNVYGGLDHVMNGMISLKEP